MAFDTNRQSRIGVAELMNQAVRLPAVVAYVRRLAPGCYLRSEVAEALGVSKSTLHRLALRNPALGPSSYTNYGAQHVWLYSEADVDRIHAHLRGHHTNRGRPTLWTPQERRQRRAASCAIAYRRRRSAELHDRGLHDDADRVAAEAADLTAHLASSHATRSARPMARRQ
jgi:hypothetical protein